MMVKKVSLLFTGWLLVIGLWGCIPLAVPNGQQSPSLAVSESPAIWQTTQVSSLSSPTAPTRLRATLTPTTPATRTPVPTVTPIPTVASPPPDLACWSQGGTIEKKSLSTQLLPQPLEFRVYLPPCYQEQPQRRYPVLYLIHGQSNDDEQWDRLGVDEVLDRLVAAHDLPPFIVVMPRDRVWTQPKDDPFGQAVIEVLLPWIDANYRTRLERSMRAIGGLSRGGGWALRMGLSEWESFGAIGGHSMAIFNSDQPYYINQWLDAIPPAEMPRIYLDLGDHDRAEITRSDEAFEEVLTERGIAHEWHVFPGYHEEAYWAAHVEDYLRWYASGW